MKKEDIIIIMFALTCLIILSSVIISYHIGYNNALDDVKDNLFEHKLNYNLEYYNDGNGWGDSLNEPLTNHYAINSKEGGK